MSSLGKNGLRKISKSRIVKAGPRRIFGVRATNAAGTGSPSNTVLIIPFAQP